MATDWSPLLFFLNDKSTISFELRVFILFMVAEAITINIMCSIHDYSPVISGA